MKKSRLSFFVLIIVTFLIPIRSYGLHYLFSSIDANGDGKIDHTEFSEDMKAHAFDKLDYNNDKEVSLAEWERLDRGSVRREHTRVFGKIDEDGDESLTVMEFSSYADEHSNIEESFITLDRNENGFLSPDEISVRPSFRMITIHFR